MVMKIQKKPVIVEGMRFTGTLQSAKEICQWVNAGVPPMEDPIADYTYGGGKDEIDLRIWTLEGQHRVIKNAVVIKGVEGEFYPCRGDIFDRTYDILPRPTGQKKGAK